MGDNGANPTKDGQGGTESKWKDSNTEQVCLKSNEQMPTLLPHLEKVI